MGLFDIFKKRNNEEEKNNSKVEEVKSDETAAVDDEQKADEKVDQVSEQATVTSEKEQEQEPSDQEEDSKESDVDDNADEEKVEEQNVEEQPAAEKPVEDDQTKFTEGLEKSRSTFGERLNRLFANFRSVDEDFFEDLEDTLIESDVGFDMAVNLTDQLRDEVKLQNAKSKDDVQNVIIQKMIDIYDQNGNDENTEIHFASQGPTVILFVGVNGVGKTTTIGKMANMYKQQGKKVLLAAADTFRAGAIQQLDEWAKRDGVDIVKKPEQSDPSAVVYEAVHKAKDENYDILFVDTAGRLQNKVNLMNELAKMKKVLTREIPDAPNEVLLVLDSTTGQNALNQAKLFKETTNVSGIVLTKLDGTAKGGIVLAIRNELHVPVKYVGLGEKVEDLREFNANDFVYGLFKGLIK
ncbi:Signal recognition particle receptor FtsY [Apilactobacillus kunkeei]|uniref:signal recognition particle-docking protein FtsY n=1 Tax=Apilactobacillus kunkeei TaxID=148814 RepID=UPI00200A0420|nr:signal recognition particle-docking protein FtsY [Apilactobacillus kunkeei]MCK8633846.1 signal recognition particle-docking protein FtsY [Apilactobacillus kunkeei]CAI2595429.1 Signal recognition particle receptor FtsY [Apilactobacillus kunkeei]CAI2595810.1 Signal recognition particle receptor FtsY [Apilactobacillus kunkeei]CAI2596006.1 Signal recognition particle receptor FtsY [Apilactobacillus kunkeei]CAI2596346.1 Signal recognition particle receptor FtsY [Apilactobacillus kunkeei]